jgi:hypothetical protein
MSDKRAYYARAYSRQEITPRPMDSFATTWSRWPSEINDANDRKTVMTQASGWRKTARELSPGAPDGEELVRETMPDQAPVTMASGRDERSLLVRGRRRAQRPYR